MKKTVFNLVIIAVAIALALWFQLNNENVAPVSSDEETQTLLAMSWQPAFCETKPNKPECRSQRKGRFDEANFTLHGLWPQPRDNIYCGVPRSLQKTSWRNMPKLELSEAMRDELATKMPGYRSFLHRHEWFKHGTCLPGADPQGYYEISLKLLDRFNTSPLRELFANNIGRELTHREVAAVMKKAFGNGAEQRISLDCLRDGRRQLIVGINIALKVHGNDDITNISENILSAPTRSIGCKSGIVDLVGLQ